MSSCSNILLYVTWKSHILEEGTLALLGGMLRYKYMENSMAAQNQNESFRGPAIPLLACLEKT